MTSPYKVVDLFAGPGGLGEGFSALRGQGGERRFEIALSVEKEPWAHDTLRLRAFLRQFETFPDIYYAWINGDTDAPDWSSLFPSEWKAAGEEAQCLELGKKHADKAVHARVDRIGADAGDRTILIGGPPCQAYSIAGRSRNAGKEGYVPENDERHFLYREYISILNRITPSAFVMENVKGLLSSSVNGEGVAEKILADLRSAGRDKIGYHLLPLRSEPELFDHDRQPAMRDFIIRSEHFGIPQARHRIIIVGVRSDVWQAGERNLPALKAYPTAVAQHVLTGLPKIRSGLSREHDDFPSWHEAVEFAFEQVIAATKRDDIALANVASERMKAFLAKNTALARSSDAEPGISTKCHDALRSWIIDDRLTATPNHEGRAHMRSDLSRYLFASLFARLYERSPTSKEFPRVLAPAHGNWKSGAFADRFRVQVSQKPSTTVTSHISKDGHYFIHPDPLQCRSLTVREAARLQTFPDNYLFLGNKTQQYIQVGNAVPPFLANTIARTLWNILEATPAKRKNARANASTRTPSMSNA
jgi:DNA (cytosine-5)-methyltransferase 1